VALRVPQRHVRSARTIYVRERRAPGAHPTTAICSKLDAAHCHDAHGAARRSSYAAGRDGGHSERRPARAWRRFERIGETERKPLGACQAIIAPLSVHKAGVRYDQRGADLEGTSPWSICVTASWRRRRRRRPARSGCRDSIAEHAQAHAQSVGDHIDHWPDWNEARRSRTSASLDRAMRSLRAAALV